MSELRMNWLLFKRKLSLSVCFISRFHKILRITEHLSCDLMTQLLCWMCQFLIYLQNWGFWVYLSNEGLWSSNYHKLAFWRLGIRNQEPLNYFEFKQIIDFTYDTYDKEIRCIQNKLSIANIILFILYMESSRNKL